MFFMLSSILVASCSLFAIPAQPENNQTGSGASPSGLVLDAVNFQGVNFNPMTFYFDNLTYSVPLNTSDQCVYIALNLVLSFYDSFLCDDIFNNGYERPSLISPIYDTHGNLINFAFGASGSPAASYSYDADYSKDDQDELNTNSSLLDIVPSGRTICGNGIPYGLMSWGLWGMFSYTSIPSSMITSYLDAGVPVITNIGSAGNGHCVVAFNHNGLDDILFHNGYPLGNPWSYPTFGSLPLESFYDSYVVLPSANIGHVCSVNYVDNAGSAICPCMFPGYCLDINHTHTNTYYSAHSHYSTCLNTGSTVLNLHRFQVDESSVTHAGHSEVCSCGDSVFHAHSPSSYSYVDYDDHLIHFDDGCSLQEGHYVVDIMPYGTDVHRIECVCGADGIGQHFEYFSIPYNGNYYMVCGCGFTNYPGGLTQEQQEAVRAQYLLELNGGNE